MPFARRRLEPFDLNAMTSIIFSDELRQTLMPNISLQGPVSVDYSLGEPEFYTSVITVGSESYLFIIGIIVTLFLFIKYLVKALKTVPYSPNIGNIIGHVFALKTGGMILYPTYAEYIDFCYGFTTADLPWLNKTFGELFGDISD